MSKRTILKQLQSFYLFAEPSFIEGISRVLDLGGNLQAYNEASSSLKADKEAIGRDWQVVGEDIKQSIAIYGQGQPTSS